MPKNAKTETPTPVTETVTTTPEGAPSGSETAPATGENTAPAQTGDTGTGLPISGEPPPPNPLSNTGEPAAMPPSEGLSEEDAKARAAARSKIELLVKDGKIPTREDFIAAGCPEAEIDAQIAMAQKYVAAAADRAPWLDSDAEPALERTRPADPLRVLADLMKRQSAEFLRITGHMETPELMLIREEIDQMVVRFADDDDDDEEQDGEEEV